MIKLENYSIFLGLVLLSAFSSAEVYKVCSGDGQKEICTQLSRGNPEVNCVWVQDSVECAKRILNNTADFGMFSAESILHLAVLNWPDLSVVQPFAHKERVNELFDFASVAIVRKEHQNGLEGLKGKKYCHPGYDHNPSERWSDRFFKHFERKVTTPKCVTNKSPAEIETLTLSEFFGDSCRPGIWSYDQNEDKELKKKYSSLCKLCPSKSNCGYTNVPQIDKNHEHALKCLKDGGDVAYVSLQEAQKFFNSTPDVNTDDYRYLCPDGTIVPIAGNPIPCRWLGQPWKAIISKSDVDKEIKSKINKWMTNGLTGLSWESSLRKILKVEDFRQITSSRIESPREYISHYRNVPSDETYCNSVISWCTVSELERQKCEIARAGGISTGIYPQIKCRAPVGSTVQCLADINRNDTDFMGIDSNYGWLARTNYNLTAALFFDTEIEQFSSIVIVVKDRNTISNFSDLRGKRACLPEFGSSPAIALVNELKEKKIFDQNQCNYGLLLRDFLGDSCLPGAQDWHYVKENNASQYTSLCNLCFQGSQNGNGNYGDLGVSINGNSSRPSWRRTSIASCSADVSNRYFGNRGGLKCLNEVGDFAVLELQSLKAHAEEVEINPEDNNFRILCKNNTISAYDGFEVDLNCALTTVVDGEIIMYRKSPKTSSVVHVLLALEHYFIRKNNPSFKIYNIFDGERNVLFKDSTIGLTHTESVNEGLMVTNYKKLFKDVERCAGNSAITISINVLSTIFVIIAAYIINH